MKKTVLILVPLLIVGLYANSKKIDPEETTTVKSIGEKTIIEGTTVGKYSKPGAPIDMSYKTTKVDTNETADVNITLTTTAQSGRVVVNITLDDKLTLVNNLDMNQSFEIAPNSKLFNIDMKVRAETDGLYYIRLLTKVEKGQHPKLRSFAIPVMVGENPKLKTRNGVNFLKAKSGENISVSKAVETIEVIEKK